MTYYKITSPKSGEVLFDGDYSSFRHCLEDAVRQNTALCHADLRGHNLAGANLDNALMDGALFDECNLIDANLSEASLRGARFINCSLQSACLCFADLRECDFSGSSFGATDIAGAKADGGIFTTLSAFTLNFRDAESLGNCRYRKDGDETDYFFSTKPVYIHGLDLPVVILDDNIVIGDHIRPCHNFAPSWTGGLNNRIPAMIKSFIREHDGFIRQIITMKTKGQHFQPTPV